MYKLTITSETEESITLSPQGNKNYSVISITGLNPVSANVNTSPLGQSPGEIFNSSRAGMRNIVINLILFNKVEETRRELYGIFQSGKKVTLTYENSSGSYFISGYIESIDCDLFTNQEKMQISIICPYPYFKSTSPVFLSSDMGVIYLYNDGIEVGCTITLSGTNPTIKSKFNYNTRQEMELTSSGGIVINTQYGNKKIIEMQNGSEIFPFTSKHDWITLLHGSNEIRATNVSSMQLMYTPEYDGV